MSTLMNSTNLIQLPGPARTRLVTIAQSLLARFGGRENLNEETTVEFARELLRAIRQDDLLIPHLDTVEAWMSDTGGERPYREINTRAKGLARCPQRRFA